MPPRTWTDRIDVQECDAGSGEERLIAAHVRPLATRPGALGVIDDAGGVGAPARHDFVVETAMGGGVHGLSEGPPGALARKALRSNLSDPAAKGRGSCR
jgi:thiamine-monophosphate kinase